MKFYLCHRRVCDFSLAAIISITLYFLVSARVVPNPQSQAPQELLTITTISMTLLGFTLTSSTFLVSNLRSEQYKLLRNSSHSKSLASILTSNFWRLFTISLFSLVSYMLWPVLSFVTVCALVFFAIQAMLALMTLIWTVSAILRIEFK